MTVVLTFRKRPPSKRYPAARLIGAAEVQGEVILFPGIQRVRHADTVSASTALSADHSGRPRKEH